MLILLFLDFLLVLKYWVNFEQWHLHTVHWRQHWVQAYSSTTTVHVQDALSQQSQISHSSCANRHFICFSFIGVSHCVLTMKRHFELVYHHKLMKLCKNKWYFKANNYFVRDRNCDVQTCFGPLTFLCLVCLRKWASARITEFYYGPLNLI